MGKTVLVSILNRTIPVESGPLLSKQRLGFRIWSVEVVGRQGLPVAFKQLLAFLQTQRLVAVKRSEGRA